MAGALVAGAFLSSFVNVVFDRLSSPEFVNWIKGKKLDEKLLGRLKTTLNVVRAVLNDAEHKQITDSAVKDWLSDLEDAVYKADDLIDELSTKAVTQKDPGNIWTRYFNSQDREMASKIEQVIDTLEGIVKHKDILGLEKNTNPEVFRKIPSTSLVEKSGVYGRKEDKEAIMKLLLDDTSDAGVSVVPIVGMGGVGKTTLAQLVYNDGNLEGNFDCKAWVCVSEQFDIVQVTKTITAAVTRSSCEGNDLNLLQTNLKDKLSGKKFLIVLDDMWNDRLDEWKILRKPFQYGNKGSKILVTTRSDSVAFVMQTIPAYRLSFLLEEDCWSMFVEHALLSDESREYSTLEQIGRKIVAKCKGLPLAVETLGGLLRANYDVNYWDNILQSEIWQLSDDERRIIPALRISYHYLPSHLKRCFVYCSLYPKDYEFDKHELILLWMAEDFLLLPKGTKTLEEIGCEYFNELVARFFLQPSSATKGLFVMHDLMHDLATLCAAKFYFRVEEFENADEIDGKTRHLSHNAKGNYPISEVVALCDSPKHIRTFLEVNACNWDHSDMGNTFSALLSHLKCSRVLSFKSFRLHSLPHTTIGELIHMRYLDISHTFIKTLPESLNKLYNLQTLKLNDCYNLEMLPSGMQDLVNLRHLDIRRTRLQEMPKGMSKLTQLQVLSNYVVGKHGESKISELGPLASLRGSLGISKLENVASSDEALEARMSDKKYINSLVLSWMSDSIDDSQFERDVLDKLQPHRDLKVLSICGYMGTVFPDWFGYSSYKNMTTLTLKACNNCCMLPSLGQLPSLKHLEISRLNKLCNIGVEFYKNDDTCVDTPFPSLETLKFNRLDCLQEWNSLGFDNAFPQLRELIIEGCPVLIGDLPDHLPALRTLTIRKARAINHMGCEQLVCSLPRAPAMLSATVEYVNELRMKELSLSLCTLIISFCDSAISFPGDCLPPSLEYLEIKNCKKLDFPMQHQQQHESLLELRIFSSCDSLTSFPLNAFPNLKDLQITHCENMKSFAVSQSQAAAAAAISCLPSLKIYECPNLVSLSTLATTAPHLKTLDIRNCPELDSFPEGGLPPNLRELQIRGCNKLVSWVASMDLHSHQSLTDLYISDASESEKSFPMEGCLPASLKKLTLMNFPCLETLDCNGLLHLTSLKSLHIISCHKLVNMTGERLPTSVTHLVTSDCELLLGRFQMKDPQIWSKISHVKYVLTQH